MGARLISRMRCDRYAGDCGRDTLDISNARGWGLNDSNGGSLFSLLAVSTGEIVMTGKGVGVGNGVGSRRSVEASKNSLASSGSSLVTSSARAFVLSTSSVRSAANAALFE